MKGLFVDLTSEKCALFTKLIRLKLNTIVTTAKFSPLATYHAGRFMRFPTNMGPHDLHEVASKVYPVEEFRTFPLPVNMEPKEERNE